MSEHEFDVVVIGLGPGGEDVAEALAGAGWPSPASTSGLVGGECPYYGCIPSKMMMRGPNCWTRPVASTASRARRRLLPDCAPVHAGSGTRPPTDWDDTVAVERLDDRRRVFARHTAGSPARDRRSDRVERARSHRGRHGRRRHRHGARAPAECRGPGAARSVLDEPRGDRTPRPRRRRSSCSVAVRSGASWRRRSRGSATTVTSSRPPTGSLPPEEPDGRPRCCGRCSSARASPCCTGAGRESVGPTVARSP